MACIRAIYSGDGGAFSDWSSFCKASSLAPLGGCIEKTAMKAKSPDRHAFEQFLGGVSMALLACQNSWLSLFFAEVEDDG